MEQEVRPVTRQVVFMNSRKLSHIVDDYIRLTGNKKAKMFCVIGERDSDSYDERVTPVKCIGDVDLKKKTTIVCNGGTTSMLVPAILKSYRNNPVLIDCQRDYVHYFDKEKRRK